MSCPSKYGDRLVHPFGPWKTAAETARLEVRETVKQCFRHCLGLATGVTTTYSYRTRRIKQEWQCVTIHPEQPSPQRQHQEQGNCSDQIAPGCAACTNLLRSFVCLTCWETQKMRCGSMASWCHQESSFTLCLWLWKCLENQDQSVFFGA